MEDGVLMAPAPYSAPAAYYFPLTTRLSGIEVFKGPSAIKYGPNTIGGAVNFTTRSSVARGQKGAIDVATGSFGANKVHAHFGQGNGRVGYVLEGARVSSDGFKRLDGVATQVLRKAIGCSNCTRTMGSLLGSFNELNSSWVMLMNHRMKPIWALLMRIVKPRPIDATPPVDWAIWTGRGLRLS